MNIEYKKITDFPRGTLLNLLKDGYSFEPRFERDFIQQWQEFDDFFYDNPKIAEKYGFMTTIDGKPIGFVTWDPRKLPELVEVGHNCISSKYKGNGYGKRQMKEAIDRIIKQGAKKVRVFTNEILIPAQHTYESAGFKSVNKSDEPVNEEYAGKRIHYEIIIEK